MFQAQLPYTGHLDQFPLSLIGVGPPDSCGPPSLASEVEVSCVFRKNALTQQHLQRLIGVVHHTSATSQMVDNCRHLSSVGQICHKELSGNLLQKKVR